MRGLVSSTDGALTSAWIDRAAACLFAGAKNS